ncbi:MAG: hypothetical protein P8Y64_02095 [Gammaproteobacteria bacterium]|jgi:hypothetical protein
MKHLLPILTLTLLAGCQSMQGADNRYALPAVGSRIVLHRPLTVPPDATRVFVQDGKVVRYGNLDLYRTSCSFEIRTLSGKPRSIMPDSFTVTRVIQDTGEVVMRKPVMVASRRLSGLDSEGPSFIFYKVEMRLKSAKQPNVMRVTCNGAQAEPANAEPPTLQEIHAALGGVATLQAPAPGN